MSGITVMIEKDLRRWK